MKTVRTIHHLAASGGTIISKALAAQPQTIVLSEISPVVGPIRFNPFDPMQQFIRNYLAKDAHILPEMNRGKFARQILAERIRQIYEIASDHGRKLIIRDHAHSDFMAPKPRAQSTLLRALREYGFQTISIVTVCDPVDTWLSGQVRGWNRGAETFDEYCRRFLLLVDGFGEKDTFRFEDFVLEPHRITSSICNRFDVQFDPSFQSRIGSIMLTGDSGRSSDVIEPRERRPMTESFSLEVGKSQNYRIICARFGYCA